MPIEIESPEQLGYHTIRRNLSESSVADRRLRDLNVDLGDVLLCYGDHRGSIDLRDTVAGFGKGLEPDDVLITAGASSALFIVATSLLDADGHIVVVRPNYATNIETPRAIGCDITYIDLDFDAGFRLDIDRIEAAIRPETRYVSLTYPHNPSGVMISEAELREVVALVERKGCLLLFDETYREMTFGAMLPLAASLSPRAISISSLSKTYGIPGIRIGWLICGDPELMQLFLAAKEQIGISGSMIDEYVGYIALRQREKWLEANDLRIREGFEIVRQWIARDDLVEWVEPQGGCVCLPRIRPDVKVDLPGFYKSLYTNHGTYVGAGRWFELPDNYFRIGFGWPTLQQLSEGLDGISAAIRENVK
ncbi:pyridoxal phosphate-dependent aminotransferase [Paracoccus denitrificans]|uniref:pyridoxal phosphate-dependent aminotransferase n=1 Tax=Paracoccus denitrificans TaxID=266 RepID=UPI0018F864A5|nr:pyridoxal phosphate-dependent aminotransferase [Paracoccus denitrificans]